MAAGIQAALIGDDVPVASGAAGSEVTNDLDAVQSVLALALEPGLMIGPAGQVARKLDRAVIALVSEAEAATVRQLIQSRHLTVGGHHAVKLAGRPVSARSVLVPAPTRALVSRWRAYQPLH